MIIKGTSRTGPSGLAAHLGNAEANEKVSLVETRGTVASDLRGALIEMDAYGLGTKCEKPLYHAAISPEPPHRLNAEQQNEAVDALELKLGLSGHARVVVIHEKHDREHIHVVWSRIDLQAMKAATDSHNYRKHEEVARDLERRFGHDRIQGAHHEREGVDRPDRTPSRSELRQEERTGIKGKEVKLDVTAAFRASDSPRAFQSALADSGYVLAKGDRRDFVVIDPAGGVHSLARRLDGMKAAGLREFMAPLDRESLPSPEQVKVLIADRKQRAAEEEHQAQIARVSKAYGRGDDYVSQSTAALKEAEIRHKRLNDPDRPPRPNRQQRRAAERAEKKKQGREDSQSVAGKPDRPRFETVGQTAERRHEDVEAREVARRRGEEEQARRREQEKSAETQRATTPTKETGGHMLNTDSIEMTDAMFRMLAQIDDGSERGSRTGEPPGRQHEAPGGGRTRSR